MATESTEKHSFCDHLALRARSRSPSGDYGESTSPGSHVNATLDRLVPVASPLTPALPSPCIFVQVMSQSPDRFSAPAASTPKPWSSPSGLHIFSVAQTELRRSKSLNSGQAGGPPIPRHSPPGLHPLLTRLRSGNSLHPVERDGLNGEDLSGLTLSYDHGHTSPLGPSHDATVAKYSLLVSRDAVQGGEGKISSPPDDRLQSRPSMLASGLPPHSEVNPDGLTKSSQQAHHHHHHHYHHHHYHQHHHHHGHDTPSTNQTGVALTETDGNPAEAVAPAASAHQQIELPALSCPYRKRNPLRFNVRDYERCANQPIFNIAELKHHIRRFHHHSRPAPFECCRCKRRFPRADALERHSALPPRISMCEARPGWTTHNPEDGITDEIDGILMSAGTETGSTAKQWEEIWRLIFPRDERAGDLDFEPVVELVEVRQQFREDAAELRTALQSELQEQMADLDEGRRMSLLMSVEAILESHSANIMRKCRTRATVANTEPDARARRMSRTRRTSVRAARSTSEKPDSQQSKVGLLDASTRCSRLSPRNITARDGDTPQLNAVPQQPQSRESAAGPMPSHTEIERGWQDFLPSSASSSTTFSSACSSPISASPNIFLPRLAQPPLISATADMPRPSLEGTSSVSPTRILRLEEKEAGQRDSGIDMSNVLRLQRGSLRNSLRRMGSLRIQPTARS